MNYTSILRRAGEITWRYRALWLFGVLLAIFGGGGVGGGGGNGGSGVRYNINGGDVSRLNIPPQTLTTMVLLIVMVMAVLLLVMIILSVVVGNTARGALIGMVDEVERTGTTSISSGFRTGWARFLRLFAIGFAIGVPVAVVLIALLLIFVGVPVVVAIIAASHEVGATALAVVAGIAAVGMFLLWLLLAIVTGVCVEVLLEVMYRRCVLEQEGVFESIREGYRMVRRNLRDVGLAWLILFGINLAFSILMVPVSIFALGLAALPGLAVWAAARSIVAAALAALPFLSIVIAALVVVQGIYMAFRSAVWTLVYREIVARGRGAGSEAPLPEPVA